MKSSLSKSFIGEPLYGPTEVLGDVRLSAVLRPIFLSVCSCLGIDGGNASSLADRIWAKGAPADLLAFERELQAEFKQVIRAGTLRTALDRRAEIIAGQVEPHIVGDHVADVGCGDGMVSWYLNSRNRFAFTLYDVCNYLDARVGFPLVLFSESEAVPMREADTSLLLTVLHHAFNPLELLGQVGERTREHVVIIESIYGVEEIEQQAPSPLRDLDRERQRMYATFIDWLYNRVFHDGVPVPYNYASPRKWRDLFESLGWTVGQQIDLGVDQPIVPEHHILFVLHQK